jgi:hypothetical protein
MVPVNEPVPVPAAVFISAVVGLSYRLQQMPLPVTAAPPSEEIVPPLSALFVVMEAAGLVERTDRVGAGTGAGSSFFEHPPAMMMARIPEKRNIRVMKKIFINILLVISAFYDITRDCSGQ